MGPLSRELVVTAATQPSDDAERASGEEPRRLARRQWWLRLVIVAGATVAYPLSFFERDGAMPTFLVCPTRYVTDLPCPSCGFTRAWFAISSGDFRAALELNVLSFLAYGVGLFLIGFLGWELATHRDVLAPFLRRHRRVIYGLIIVLIVARYAVLWTLHG